MTVVHPSSERPVGNVPLNQDIPAGIPTEPPQVAYWPLHAVLGPLFVFVGKWPRSPVGWRRQQPLERLMKTALALDPT